MPLSHTVSAFDRELERLTSSIGAMGDFAGAQVADAVRALLHGDTELARRVVDQDRQIDALRRDLSASAALVIAKRQPLAGDLDELLADFKVIEDLERIGDLAKNVAKRAVATAGIAFPDELVAGLDELATLAVDQLRQAVASFVARDANGAMAVREQDETTDLKHTAIFKDLVSRMGGEPLQVIGFVHLLFCAKNIERIGDHATNIAEAAYQKSTGRQPETERRKLDESSLIGENGKAGGIGPG